MNTALSAFGLLVVNKPVNVLAKSLLTLSKSAGSAVSHQLILVNRIDLLTSGLVVLGISRVSAKLCCKVYLCVADCSIIGSRLRISCWVRVKARWKLCVAYFVLRTRVGGFALVNAVLVTGRNRQLRRQLLGLGSAEFDLRGCCLHSVALQSECGAALANVSASVL
ncbi:Pseudouridine synthase [Candidatus Hodgkinia cicadicola]|nr:Pseudouridine synthase [Candidatus Hodgkinia cicadicola]